MPDELTGVATRREFEERLDGDFRHAREQGLPLSLIAVDLDRLKHVNDVHGHLTGDETLRMVAAELVELVGPGGFVARSSGDEFVALLPGRDREAAISMAERCRQSVEHIYPASRRITASFGVATLTANVGNANGLFDRADMAMYDAKRSGGNCIRERG